MKDILLNESSKIIFELKNKTELSDINIEKAIKKVKKFIKTNKYTGKVILNIDGYLMKLNNNSDTLKELNKYSNWKIKFMIKSFKEIIKTHPEYETH